MEEQIPNEGLLYNENSRLEYKISNQKNSIYDKPQRRFEITITRTKGHSPVKVMHLPEENFIQFLNDMKYRLTERKQWFINRIGKTVYRSVVTCDCKSCEGVYTDGITIGDEQHAIYLYDWECITSIDYPKLPVRYFDTIAERNYYELTKK